MEIQQNSLISRVGKFLEENNKNLRVPNPGRLTPKNRLKTRAKVFCVNLPGRVKKRPFSANDCCLSPDPDFSSLPNFHPLIERSSAEDV